MKLKLLLICFFGTLFSMQAQTSVKPTILENSGIISGKITDKKTNEPLPYVNIVVKENDKVITGGITSDKGTFQIKNLALKDYTVEIQFIGYKTISKPAKLSEDNSILNHFLGQIRNVNVHNDSMRFRRNIERIGEIMAYELSKKLHYKSVEIQTPLGIKKTTEIQDQLVLCSILRAGLPLHLGFLNYFDNAENGFVSAFRHHPNKIGRAHV